MKSSPLTSELEMVHASARADIPAVAQLDNPTVTNVRLLWDSRRFLFRVACWGLLAATLIAFLIPKEYESTTRLMPPDDQSSSGLAMFAAMSAKMQGGLGSIAGDVLGLKSSGALFIAIL